MRVHHRPADLVIAVSPLARPSSRFVAAAAQAGCLAVLDLTTADRTAREHLQLAAEWTSKPFGVRLSGDFGELPAAVDTVLLTAPPTQPMDGYRVLVEVTSLDEALLAAEAGADGLLARGHEAGGRVGELSTFVLLQQLLGYDDLDLPVWAWGGIGPRTAAAAVVGGAAGVVLDTQLALLPEAEVPVELAALISTADGSETTVVDGRRTFSRRGIAVPEPIGQDVFLASRFLETYGSVGAAVRGVRDAVLAAADPAPPLSLPVVQGPMTRVSDQAAFAKAVADEGGLPFIALALSGPEQTRAVLEQTRDALGEAPWGVGVLGFAAEEVKAAQLEVIREIRPSHAIIAGGRPAQAAALEEVGVSTYLHVPSPGLLKQFLEAGARKFVFEGAECGGHVGPRNSFPLWEAQLDVIANSKQSPDGLEVLFAGGIHDERSAAMVRTLAAPLARSGAAVGVLMGTAYLFTDEAVEAGAVLPLFRQQVIDAERTDLLETAPGHATRCVASPFTDEYAAFKQDLQAREVPSREAWEQLEQLNVGRLRLASKGIERVGNDLRPVDDTRQLGEGMFMAGEVAVLRSAATTVATLHAAVLDGATTFVEQRAVELRQPSQAEQVPEPLDIAIVGMACMFPQSPDLSTFWSNVVAGVDAVTEVPAERWDPAVYFAPDGHGERTPSRWGGFLPEIDFDPLRYGIPPASLASIEPVQLLALEAAQRALVDAGYESRPFDRSRTSVVFGAEAGSDLSNATTLRTVLPSYLGELPDGLDEQLPRLTEDSFPGMLANVIAGRIANRLDLGGANYTVDAACASSLAAVDVACKELTAGTSDLVLCGGADLHNGINDYLLFSSVHALSPSGRSATFDESADGIALGEGVACVALKRLADAERDGDRVYAVIRGVGSASDGRSLGLTAPRPEGQRSALERAYRAAGLSPAQVGLVEAHGTGTVVGDRTELATLTNVFTEAGATAGGCAIGSVKSQIGHTKCTAGMAGLIKSALALHTGIKPPTLHVRTPNAAWDADSSPFAFHSVAAPWTTAPADRVAGVSAFGFGGTNFHAVLTAYDEGPPPEQSFDEWPAELFLFRTAKHAEEVLRLVEADTGDLEPWRLRDLALSAARRYDLAGSSGTALAILAADVETLAPLLRRAIAGEDAPHEGIFQQDSAPGEVAFLFPGQGSQRPGMLGELFVAFPELQRFVRAAEPAVRTALFPAAAFDEQGQRDQLARITDTRMAQPALGIAGLATDQLLRRAGVRPAMMAGHSYGELVALAASGVLTPEALLACSSARAEAILDATGDDPGTMAAVAAEAPAVAAALEAAGLGDAVVIANRNSPRQTVISGTTAGVEKAVERLRDAGVGAKRIPVACAFHSPLVAEAGNTFAKVLAAVPITAPKVPVWSNRTAGEYSADPERIRAELSAQIGSPVGFVEEVEAMYAAGARVFVEAGPGATLTRLVDAILGDRPHRTVALEGRRRTGLAGFLAALAQLAVAGVDVRTTWLYRGRDAVDAATAVRRKRPGWTVDGQLVRTATGAIPSGALQPAQRVTFSAPEHTMNYVPAQNGSEQLVAEFLRTSRDLIAAQRDVLLAHLGTTGSPAVLPAPVVVPAPQPAAPVLLPPVVADPEPAAPEATAPELDEASVLAAVLQVIAERTGYPVDMIEPGLDLEADLSVDSIKRAEIAGELATRLNLPPTSDIDTLSQARTAGAITDLVVRTSSTHQVNPPDASPAQPTAPTVQNPGLVSAPGPAPEVVAPKRLVLAEVELAEAGATDLSGRTFLLVGDGALDRLVADKLKALGATSHTDAALPCDGVFFLNGDDVALPDVFATYQAVLARSPRWIIAAGPVDGLRGFFRTVAREYPDTIARVVEHDPGTTPDVVADGLIAELTDVDREPVVLRPVGNDTTRYGLRLEERGLGLLGSTGAGPAGDGAAEVAALDLDRESVVLMAGGAKGITARFAATLAAAARCRIELLGRSPLPTGDESPAVAAATTPAELRAAFIADGLTSPAEIERSVARLESAREIRATIDRLTGLGATVRYHSVDVRDAEAVHGVVKDIHAEHGRIDGLVYAAGVIEDKVIADKTAASFANVYRTKVDGAKALLDATGQLPAGPRFAVLFGSIAGVLGNRGQADYASANDALEHLGTRWSGPGRRGLTVHWGPWAPTGENNGMVTPELMRTYAARGIALIDPEEGVLGLLRELAWGPESATSVVYTASGW
ncbi:SDR family oxidoreductase [Kribbella sp. NBC_00482]|uniref:SDR family NAD(P)-dependent oxidoreductase n=1 Tax=Kribbella sp. NBC_00482 TaxID=2975968 RepID=UPI002E19EBD5